MKAYICPQCGGYINRAKMICEYCGTQFREEINEIKIVAYHPGVHTLGAEVVIPTEYIRHDPEEMRKFVIHEMARKYAEELTPFIDVEMYDRTIRDETIFRSRLRVVGTNYRFG